MDSKPCMVKKGVHYKVENRCPSTKLVQSPGYHCIGLCHELIRCITIRVHEGSHASASRRYTPTSAVRREKREPAGVLIQDGV